MRTNRARALTLIYQPTDATTLHAGYARYFTPPPLENVPATQRRRVRRHLERVADDQDDPVKAERANYFDAGISQKLAPGLQVGVDGYYKNAKNQLDDGLFGQTLILSAFNYAEGEVLWRGVHRLIHHRRLLHLCQRRLLGRPGQRLEFRPVPVRPERTSLTSRITGSTWTTIRRVTGSFGASYLWKHDARQLASLC